MNLDLKRRIAELREMPVTQLREQHLKLFGEPNNSGHREYLFRRIAWRLQAQAEGDLSERARKRAMELARDADVRTTAPKPPGIASGDTAALASSNKTVRTGTIKIGADDRLPMPGAVLTRKFKGRTYTVTVHPVGFEMDGDIYKSLSAVAKAITGSHWNGYLFFGLTPAPGKSNPPKKRTRKESHA